MHSGLVQLGFRRTLSPGTGAVLAAGLVLSVLASGHAAALVPDADAEVLLRFGRRLDAWAFSALLAAPLLLLQVARLGAAGELRWLRLSPEAPARILLALGAGVLAALALVVLATAVAAECAAGEGPPAWRRCALRPTPAGLITAENPVIVWKEPALVAPGARLLRLSLSVAPGSGPAVDARWNASVRGRGTQVEARLAGRTWLALPLPEALEKAPTPVDFELRRISADGAVLVLRPDGLEALVPVASERLASLALAARALLALGVSAAWTLGLANRMRPSLAAGVPLALFALALSRGIGLGWLPAGDWIPAWSQAASGLVPSWPAGASVLCATILAITGLALRALPAKDVA